MTAEANRLPTAAAVVVDLPGDVPRLTSFYLYMTAGCNLRCRHCWITPTFVNGEPSPGECINPELLKQAVKEAKPLGLKSAKLTGGEPLMHPQFRDIAAFLKSEGIHSDMETNGILIDPSMARFLKDETNVEFVSVSLDSVDTAKHDAFRGVKGAFDAAVQGIRNLVEVGYRPQIIMSPHRDNLGEVDAMVEMAGALKAGSLKFNPVANSGRGSRMHEEGEALDYEAHRALIRYVNGELQKRSKVPLFIGAPMAMLTLDDLLKNRWRGVCNVDHIMGLLGTGHMALCGIGKNVQELSYGELGKDNLRDVWCAHPFLKELRKGIKGPFAGICGDCIHAGRCRTGCLAMHYLDGGKLFSPSPLCSEADRRGEFPMARRKQT
ncbi:MAG: radical SAM protein [Verrucomicrobia bacterium]|jgi:SynChlorMet cassette radical SAM/SPASM protein ScmF|nr:radical SAM protein [Verrucomicrobiota bacterium]MBT7065521.1 radical SAM protein [Verrucomicrobiota bacterium]MBT7700877.1 radical SAM protein [Verrucomicrobiota bacterium]